MTMQETMARTSDEAASLCRDCDGNGIVPVGDRQWEECACTAAINEGESA